MTVSAPSLDREARSTTRLRWRLPSTRLPLQPLIHDRGRPRCAARADAGAGRENGLLDPQVERAFADAADLAADLDGGNIHIAEHLPWRRARMALLEDPEPIKLEFRDVPVTYTDISPRLAERSLAVSILLIAA